MTRLSLTKLIGLALLAALATVTVTATATTPAQPVESCPVPTDPTTSPSEGA